MSEIKLSDEDIKRIAAEVIKILVITPPKYPIQERPFVYSPWKPTPTPGLPHGWQAPYSSFV